MKIYDRRPKSAREIELLGAVQKIYALHRELAEAQAAPLIEELTKIVNRAAPSIILIPETDDERNAMAAGAERRVGFMPEFGMGFGNEPRIEAPPHEGGVTGSIPAGARCTKFLSDSIQCVRGAGHAGPCAAETVPSRAAGEESFRRNRHLPDD